MPKSRLNMPEMNASSLAVARFWRILRLVFVALAVVIAGTFRQVSTQDRKLSPQERMLFGAWE